MGNFLWDAGNEVKVCHVSKNHHHSSVSFSDAIIPTFVDEGIWVDAAVGIVHKNTGSHEISLVVHPDIRIHTQQKPYCPCGGVVSVREPGCFVRRGVDVPFYEAREIWSNATNGSIPSLDRVPITTHDLGRGKRPVAHILTCQTLCYYDECYIHTSTGTQLCEPSIDAVIEFSIELGVAKSISNILHEQEVCVMIPSTSNITDMHCIRIERPVW